MNLSADTPRSSPTLAACGAVTGIVISNLEQFTRQVHLWFQAGEGSITNEKLLQFLLDADRFANSCSSQLAEAIHEYSNQPDIQASNLTVLTRLVRSRCFEQLDQVLEGYLEVLEKFELDLQRIIPVLADSSVKQAVHRLLQQRDGSGPTKRYRLPVSGRPAAFLKVLEFLEELQLLPDTAIDYAANKMFGHQQADDAVQRSFVRKIHDSTDSAVASAIALISNIDAVKEHRWEQQSAAESAVIGSVAMLNSLRETKRKSAFGRLALALLCSVPLAYVASTQHMNLYLGGIAVLCMIVALFFYYRALVAFTKAN